MFYHRLNQSGPLTNRLKYFRILLSFLFSLSYSNFSGYITALSQSPRSMILRWVNLPAVSYCAESCDISISYLKGQSNMIFDLFHNSNLPGPLGNSLRYLRFWIRFLRVIRVFRDCPLQSDTALSKSPRSMILRDEKSVSVQYHTAGILRGVNSHFFLLLHMLLKGTVSQK